jgi:glucose-6-phosphate isomerase
MLPKIDPTATAAWKKLAAHYGALKSVHMKRLFAEDPERFRNFSVRFDDILVDYSKNRITAETFR